MILSRPIQYYQESSQSDNSQQVDSLNLKPNGSTNISLPPLLEEEEDKQIQNFKLPSNQISLKQIEGQPKEHVLHQQPQDQNIQAQQSDGCQDNQNEDDQLSQEGESRVQQESPEPNTGKNELEYGQYQTKYIKKGNKNKGKGKQKRKIIVKRVGRPSKKDKLRNQSINQHLTHFWRDIQDKLLTSIHNLLSNNAALIKELKNYKKKEKKKIPEKDRWYSKLFNNEKFQIYIRECLTQDNYSKMMNEFLHNGNKQYYCNNRVPLLAMLEKNYSKGFRNYYHSNPVREAENKQNN